MTLKKGVPFLAICVTNLPSPSFTNSTQRITVVFWGRRPGRNPSSVYYDGHPSYRGTRAIGRRLTGAYIPFHNTAEANRFILMPAPPIKSSRERKPSSSHEAGQVSFLMPHAPGLPGPFSAKERALRQVDGVSSIRNARTVTVHRLTATPKLTPERNAVQIISA